MDNKQWAISAQGNTVWLYDTHAEAVEAAAHLGLLRYKLGVPARYRVHKLIEQQYGVAA